MGPPRPLRGVLQPEPPGAGTGTRPRRFCSLRREQERKGNDGGGEEWESDCKIHNAGQAPAAPPAKQCQEFPIVIMQEKREQVLKLNRASWNRREEIIRHT